MPLMLTGAGVFVPVSGGGGGGFTLAWQYASVIDNGFSSSFSFAAVPIGAASSDRIVNVHLGSNFGGFSSLTIGGVTATLAVNDGASPPLTASYYANVPTGTTCTIAGTGTGFQDIGIMVWTIHGQTGGATATPTGGAYGVNPNGGDPNQIAVTVSGGSVALISANTMNNSSAGTSSTWTNTTSSIGDGFVVDTSAPFGAIAGAHATTSATVTTTLNGGVTSGWGFGQPILWQSWGP